MARNQQAAASRTAAGTRSLNTFQLPPLFVRATFTNPLDGKQHALPPHRWVFEQVGPAGPSAMFPGAKSDSEGMSLIHSDALMHAPKTRWALRWEPWGRSLPASGVVWVDLDTHDWVDDADIQPLEKRQLVRLVAWSSVDKASAGGFRQLPTASFEVGSWEASETVDVLMDHRSLARALPISVDHDWHRTFIELRYFDLIQNEHRPVSAGLVLEALDRSGNVVGGGVAVKAGGLYHVLHQRTSAQSEDVHYRFEAPKHTIVDNHIHEEPQRVRIEPNPRRHLHHYPLPERFHSFGWDVRVEQGREPWPDRGGEICTRAFGAKSPLVFDLDDTVLVDKAKRPLRFLPNTQISALDQLVRVVSPDPQRPHLTRHVLQRNYLEGERFVYRKPVTTLDAELDLLPALQTLVVAHEDDLHLVGGMRLEGASGTTRGLGLRICAPNELMRAHPDGYPPMRNCTKGSYDHHLVPTNLEDFALRTASGVKRIHAHQLISYTSIFVRDPFGLAEKLLQPAADVLDELSPRNTDEPAAFVPRGGVRNGEPIAFSNHFFGRRTRAEPGRASFLVVEKLVTPGARGHWDPRNKSVVLLKADLENRKQFLLAHELGHGNDLPDEYLEGIHGFQHLPRDGQPRHGNTRLRPFVNDDRCLMNGGDVGTSELRLRYLWPKAHVLNTDAELSAVLGGQELVPEHARKAGVRTYVFPAGTDALVHGGVRHPWMALGAPGMVERRVSLGSAQVAVFRLGHDRSAEEVMARFSLDDGEPFLQDKIRVNAMALIRLNVEVKGRSREHRALAVMQMKNNLGGAGERQYLLTDARSRATLRNVGVQLQPLFAIDGALETPHVRVLLRASRGAKPHPLSLPPTERPAVLSLTETEMDHALVRHMLGVPTLGPSGVLRGPLSVSELVQSGVPALVQEQLGDDIEREVRGLGEGLVWR